MWFEIPVVVVFPFITTDTDSCLHWEIQTYFHTWAYKKTWGAHILIEWRMSRYGYIEWRKKWCWKELKASFNMHLKCSLILLQCLSAGSPTPQEGWATWKVLPPTRLFFREHLGLISVEMRWSKYLKFLHWKRRQTFTTFWWMLPSSAGISFIGRAWRWERRAAVSRWPVQRTSIGEADTHGIDDVFSSGGRWQNKDAGAQVHWGLAGEWTHRLCRGEEDAVAGRYGRHVRHTASSSWGETRADAQCTSTLLMWTLGGAQMDAHSLPEFKWPQL